MSVCVKRVRRTTSVFVLAGCVSLFGPCRSARATIQFSDRLQLSGNFEIQNVLRTPGWEEAEFYQQRNTVRLRVDWDWLRDGRFLDKYDLPFIRESKLYFLYRGAYDSIYDMAPGYRQTGQAREDDLIGGPMSGNEIGTLRRGCELTVEGRGTTTCLREGLYSRFTSHTRRALKIENVLREAYADIVLQDVPLTLRIGRQQVIWGEADQFRLMDIWNPIDVSWRFPMADTFDDFRVPLWLIKGMWDFGIVGPFANAFVEFVYNPFDFQPGQKIGWLPRPGSLPFADPLRSGQVSDFITEQAGSGLPSHNFARPIFDLQGTSYRKGDFHRNPEDASEFGVRAHGVTPQGIEGTINYIYGRGKFVGNAPAFGLKLEQVITERLTTNFDQLPQFVPLNGGPGFPIVPSWVRAKVVHPYVHVFGITGNYFEADITNAVLRMEMAYSLGQPFATSEEDKLLQVQTFKTGGGLEPYLGQTPVGFMKRDVFAGMVGFDRPTWIRWLNNKGTFFLTAQLFWVHIPGHNVKKLHGFSSADERPYFAPSPEGIQNARQREFVRALYESRGFGVWSTHSAYRETPGGPYTIAVNPLAGQIERVQNARQAPNDNYLPWEWMLTFSTTTFYRGGTIAPQLVTLFDPVNLWGMEALELKYFYSNDLVFTIQQRQVVPFKTPMNDPWFVGRFGRRGEVALRVTYQF